MIHSSPQSPKIPRLNLGARLTLSIGGGIIVASLALFTWLYHLQERQALQQVETQADALLTEMLIVRDWVAEYGDVWTTDPGDYYVEGDGPFYRKSPGMVTKEISVLTNARENFRFHITSLDLKNPENAPDEFELAALHKFEEMPATFSQIELVDGQRYYRRMAPLFTQDTCMECHPGVQVGEVRGGISVLVPMAEVDQALAEGRRALMITAVLITTLMTGLLYWMVRRMVIHPLRQLRGAAVAMGQGDYQAHCALQTGDELQDLGDTFNQMAGNLRQYQDSLHQQIAQRTRELNALAEMSLIISRSQDLKSVLSEALAQALQATEMEGGVIHLLGPSGGVAVTVQHGVSPAIVACMSRASSGEGCTLWGLRRSLHVIDLQADTASQDCPEIGCPAISRDYQGLVVVPLRSGNKELGTLTLLHRGETAVSPEQQQFIACLGNQLGVAVANARFQEEIERLAILEERGRIARELHDSLAQTLSWLHLKMDLLTQTIEAGNIPQTRQEALDVRQVVDQAVFEVRESIDGLRVQPDSSFSSAISTYVAEFSRRSGLPVDLTIGKECRLNPVVEIEALRILQEALTNAYKHAEATRLDVYFQRFNGYVELSVRDNGRGFNPQAATEGGHYGLRIMQERAERVKGSFYLESAAGVGTQIILRLPAEKGGALANEGETAVAPPIYLEGD
jgi:two-component system, NarL family, nitrate/nitrite sensor histidine kinase NarX